MRSGLLALLLALGSSACVSTSADATRAPITLPSLLAELNDPAALARWPSPEYRTLQASSYHRASTHRDQADRSDRGWFADSDGTGFVRTERVNGRDEFVLMEHDGPGALTRLWTPFFYDDFGERTGPNVRIYLDGASEPVIDEPLIALVRGEGTFRPPLATKTARAGDSYVPIPFARSCKVTMSAKPFYFTIAYRAYEPGTVVETFTRAGLAAAERALAETARRLADRSVPRTAANGHESAASGAAVPAGSARATVRAGECLEIASPAGPRALTRFELRVPDVVRDPALLRSTVLAFTFDGEESVWCPLGDFFCSADELHPFDTFARTASADGTFTCRWTMPYADSAVVRVLNLSKEGLELDLSVDTAPWTWDDRSMHFHARWRPDDVAPGTPFQDWEFLSIVGRGVFVGDALSALNVQGSWWGEGDEKQYVDGDWARGFPSIFGTGTEDYYGWAGGEVPSRDDEFSTPFLANVRVGGLDEHGGPAPGRVTNGFNVSTRARALDALPFRERFRFDLEASFGTDIRKPWNVLGYSAVAFYYAFPGARDDRPARPDRAAEPILRFDALAERARDLRDVPAELAPVVDWIRANALPFDARGLDESQVGALGRDAFGDGAHANDASVVGARKAEGPSTRDSFLADRDVAVIARALANARVVGLGEATHGQHESFETKRAITLALVREHGFRVVAYEASSARARASDAYVQGESDDLAAAMKGLGMLVWNVEENAALFEDLRAWNRSAAPADRVHLVGVDVQDPEAAAKRLAELVGAVLPDVAKSALAFAPEIEAAVPKLWRGETEEYERITKLAEGVLAAVEGAGDALGSAAGEAVLRARELRRGIGMHHSPGGRDAAMGEMLLDALERAGPAAKAVLWAHDGHVTNGALRYLGSEEPATGGVLKRALGKDYVAVGFAYGAGEFHALAKDAAGTWGFTRYRTAPPPAGSLEEPFHRARPGSFFVDLRGAPREGPVAAWLDAGHGKRWYGGYGVPEDAFDQSADTTKLLPTFPRADYDALVYLERTTPSRPFRARGK
ncbi:MAG: DUF2961 domain-containing protein [Planctomycetes bacterium]|nr:DUF2961 domain-containing protein [Planctomycetota bacterium]